jgi:divalent metal cation (Fe/Co/Zn/Cd) transporter
MNTIDIDQFPNPSGSAQPGWHQDPTGRHLRRYWDGSQWTGHVQNADGSTDSAAVVASVATAPAATYSTLRAFSQRSSAALRAHAAASILEVVAWIVMVLGVIGGAAIGSQAESGYYGGSRHPYVGYGVGVAIFVAVMSLMMIMIAAYIESRTE